MAHPNGWGPPHQLLAPPPTRPLSAGAALARTARTRGTGCSAACENSGTCPNPRSDPRGSVRTHTCSFRTIRVGTTLPRARLERFRTEPAPSDSFGPAVRTLIRRRRSNQRIGAARHPRWPRRDSWLVVWGRVRRVTAHDQQPPKYGRNSTSTVFCIPVNTLRDACEKSQPISHLPNTCQWARNHPPSHASALRTSIWWQSDILAVAPPPPAFSDILRPRHDPGQPSGGLPRHRRRASW